ncbi:hypothetical protein RV11_GL001175 [Enterococcus phoeniculicola]|jgi:hypothetical protein|uniref:Uncharacterized protein n=1 Tax=Enterococcus phoeniculicola ATCC BAA-412 TaxID=1158610 RepID=R3TWX3_9ENTE|nr:hypothetical protein [Enterococcus phoeniculicola]EOL46099.1 hypothetical protein UC3_00905 [Enterococcus phoeniculicola ATCC BAA-412]EOT77056.1 hypothetical protein I589_02017 [Enterococcus phoeniculicola ATCC BAA-412]OJG73395.1 hypothetical protein RV11_GL001175 [Enterococcus phoeniculicola]
MDYEKKLDELKEGTINEIEVSKENFFLFREAWLKREDRKFFVGEAHLNGDITYRYNPNVL